MKLPSNNASHSLARNIQNYPVSLQRKYLLPAMESTESTGASTKVSKPSVDLLSEIIPKLDRGDLLALGDVHSGSSARALAEALIKTGKVKILFIEYSNYKPIPPFSGVVIPALNDEIESIIHGSESDEEDEAEEEDSIHDKLEKYFELLSKSDAKPSLLDLTAFAITKGTNVAACDLDPFQALQTLLKLETLPDKNLLIKEGIKLVTPEGLNLRDTFAAQQISKYCKKVTTGRLMLWGDNHLQGYDNGKGSKVSLITKLKDAGVSEVAYVPYEEIKFHLDKS